MSGAKTPIVGEQFQQIAEGADYAVSQLLTGMHAMTAKRTGSLDAGPVITGALTGVVAFIMFNGHDEDAVREAFANVLDNMPQQFAMMKAAKAAGAREEGRA